MKNQCYNAVAQTEKLSVLEFFAVGTVLSALLFHAVKGGVSCQTLSYLHFQGSIWSLFFQLRVFITHLTLSSLQCFLISSFFSSDLIQVCKQQYGNIEFSVTSGEELPFDDDSFDMLAICCVLHHLNNPQNSSLRRKECW